MKTENKKITSFAEHLDAQHGKEELKLAINTKKNTKVLHLEY